MKYRYLKGGFEIVGDHKDAWEAKKVFQYYKDLVSEIQLRTEIDGSDIIGEKPFGMFVHLYHTEEVEREIWRVRKVSTESKQHAERI